MPRKKEIEVTRAGGPMTRAEVFEQLIWLVCGQKVKLPRHHQKKRQGQRPRRCSKKIPQYLNRILYRSI